MELGGPASGGGAFHLTAPGRRGRETEVQCVAQPRSHGLALPRELGTWLLTAILIMKLLIRPHSVTTRKAVGLSRWGSLPGMHWDLGAPRGLWAPPQDQPLPKSLLKQEKHLRAWT